MPSKKSKSKPKSTKDRKQKSNTTKRKASKVASRKNKRVKRNSSASKLEDAKKRKSPRLLKVQRKKQAPQKSVGKKPTRKKPKRDDTSKNIRRSRNKTTQPNNTKKASSRSKKARQSDDAESGKQRRSTRKRSHVSRLADQMTTQLRPPTEKKVRKTSAEIAEKAVVQPTQPPTEKKRKRKKKTKRRLALNDTDSSDDSSSDSEERWRKRAERDLEKRRDNVGLMGGPQGQEEHRKKPVSADITQMEVDTSVDWSQVGGLKGHVQKLQEMILLPMLYPENFEQFKIQPPRGVIFHGPPGTGKTLVARVLAAEASRNGKKVAFYMRKGADCLSKWVGEAERQLRLLFSEAFKNQPSIIFFDEIDGLAPVRSARQDQIHSSIVSTLLALMDGLDRRGQVIIIGATNRIDSLDPALRRPGRFDRELVFNLPSRIARRQILDIHTRNWDPRIPPSVLDELALKTVGYCGADIEGLCREAFLHCFRRTYPRIYDDNVKLKLKKKLVVTRVDFFKAFAEVVPSSKRSNIVFAKPIEPYLAPLLQEQLNQIVKIQKNTFPLGAITKSSLANLEITGGSDNENNTHFEKDSTAPIAPRLLIHGMPGLGQKLFGPAILHRLEEFPMYSIDLSSLLGDPTARSPAEALFSKVKEARRNAPSILYWPRIDSWWESLQISTVRSLVQMLEDIPDELPVYVIATSEAPRDDLPIACHELFPPQLSLELQIPTDKERHTFWHGLEAKCNQTPMTRVDSNGLPSPRVASAPGSPVSQNQNSEQEEEETPVDTRLTQEETDFRRLRTYLRTCCTRLIKHFPKFFKKINDEVVKTDISLQMIRESVNDSNDPMTVTMWLDEVDDLCEQVRGTYDQFPVDDDKGREYVNESCHLKDTALSMAADFDAKIAERCFIAAKRMREKSEENEQDFEEELEDKIVPPAPENQAESKKVLKKTESPTGVRTRARTRALKMGIPDPLSIPSMPKPPTPKAMPQGKLKEFFNDLAAATSNFNVDHLQLWFSEFNSFLYRHSDEPNRKKIFPLLQEKLQTLSAERVYEQKKLSS